jgi:hypothetical protein
MKKGLFIPLAMAALLIALSPPPAMAGKASAVINGKSYHFNSSYDWNEDNYGFGVEYEFGQKSAWKKIVMANGFRDSNESLSYMVGAGLHRRLYETDAMAGFHVYAGLTAFVMTREDVKGNRPSPGILPSVTIGNDHVGFNLTYLPRKAVEEVVNANMVDPTITGILFLQFKVSLDRLTPQ